MCFPSWADERWKRKHRGKLLLRQHGCRWGEMSELDSSYSGVGMDTSSLSKGSPLLPSLIFISSITPFPWSSFSFMHTNSTSSFLKPSSVHISFSACHPLGLQGLSCRISFHTHASDVLIPLSFQLGEGSLRGAVLVTDEATLLKSFSPTTNDLTPTPL